MKLRGRNIAFGLTDCFYAFKNTIAEMRNIALEGGKIIPIMPLDTYKTDSKFYKSADFIRDIETISDRKIIVKEEEAERVEADIMIIAPCSRKSHRKTCIFYI